MATNQQRGPIGIPKQAFNRPLNGRQPFLINEIGLGDCDNRREISGK